MTPSFCKSLYFVCYPSLKLFIQIIHFKTLQHVCLGLVSMFCSTTNLTPCLCISVCATRLYDTSLKAGCVGYLRVYYSGLYWDMFENFHNTKFFAFFFFLKPYIYSEHSMYNTLLQYCLSIIMIKTTIH